MIQLPYSHLNLAFESEEVTNHAKSGCCRYPISVRYGSI